jgi:hypothetical protein
MQGIPGCRLLKSRVMGLATLHDTILFNITG